MCSLETSSGLSDFIFFVITFQLLLISVFVVYLFVFLIPKKIRHAINNSKGCLILNCCKKNDPIMNTFIPIKYLYTFTINGRPNVIKSEDFSTATKEIRKKGGRVLFISTNDKRIID